MAEINFDLLSKITQAPGAPGFESRIRQVIQASLEGYGDESYVDNIGNLILLKRGFREDASEKPVMVDAHMDEIGFMVSYIEDSGFVRFGTLGGFDPKTLTAQRVIIHGQKDMIGILGTKAIHMMSPEERKKAPKLEDYFIDLGLPKSEIEKYISIGNPITRERDLLELGDCLTTKSLDNRISVYILVEAFKALGEVPYDTYAVFSVQEEVGLRGADVATHRIDPEFAICLDTTIANDTLGAQKHDYVTELGKGAGIKVADGYVISSSRMVDFLKSVADRNEIAWQAEALLKGGGTNAGMMQRKGKRSAIIGGISIPTRYLHQVTESVHKEDVKACIDLLVASLETLDKHHWER
ncbi:MAG: M42 family metallopeptidase [Bernardetiaceae bacterium]|nr:M42 family metallopeptidase [Bernardetiaceae bacterium]